MQYVIGFVIALFIALWQSLVTFGYAPATLLPPPGAVFLRLGQQLGTVEFMHEIGATLFRLFAGFGIAVVFGVSIGIAAAAGGDRNLFNDARERLPARQRRRLWSPPLR